MGNKMRYEDLVIDLIDLLGGSASIDEGRSYSGFYGGHPRDLVDLLGGSASIDEGSYYPRYGGLPGPERDLVDLLRGKRRYHGGRRRRQQDLNDLLEALIF